MTGTHTHERIFSRLTLAVMEDTGWYVPNYERADPLHWGQNQGCEFAKKSCKYWMDTRENRYCCYLPFLSSLPPYQSSFHLPSFSLFQIISPVYMTFLARKQNLIIFKIQNRCFKIQPLEMCIFMQIHPSPSPSPSRLNKAD